MDDELTSAEAATEFNTMAKLYASYLISGQDMPKVEVMKAIVATTRLARYHKTTIVEINKRINRRVAELVADPMEAAYTGKGGK